MSSISQKIEGNFWQKLFLHFLEKSAYYPMANLIIECLKEGPSHYFLSPDPFILLLSALLNSYFYLLMKKKNSKWILLSALTGPFFYVVLEVPIEGVAFFSAPQHLLYWVFGFSFFLLDLIMEKEVLKSSMTLIESLIQSLIPISLYIYLDMKEGSFKSSLVEFISEERHQFIGIVILLYGLILGFSRIHRNAIDSELKKLATKLKEYGQWFLGDNLLESAVDNEEIFKIKRVKRGILFIDIRGFTSWSEKRSPEEVVMMLQDYYSLAEKIYKLKRPLKAKYTADEIMLVFADLRVTYEVAIELREALKDFLVKNKLSAGTGFLYGDVVEGLMGSEEHRMFDIMGDSVNTAKRLCENAKAFEILTFLENKNELQIDQDVLWKEISLKGKDLPVAVISF